MPFTLVDIQPGYSFLIKKNQQPKEERIIMDVSNGTVLFLKKVFYIDKANRKRVGKVKLGCTTWSILKWVNRNNAQKSSLVESNNALCFLL